MRGELWTAAGGVYAHKPRPALVIQDDAYDKTESVTVIPLTTVETDAPFLRILIVPDEQNGLERRSWAMTDKITTVRRNHLHHKIGYISDQVLIDLERALFVFLGLAR